MHFHVYICQGPEGLISLNGPDQPHLEPAPTPTSLGALFKLIPRVFTISLSHAGWVLGCWVWLTCVSAYGLIFLARLWPCLVVMALSGLDSILTLTYKLASYLDLRPASSVWCCLVTRTPGWTWPLSLGLSRDLAQELWDMLRLGCPYKPSRGASLSLGSHWPPVLTLYLSQAPTWDPLPPSQPSLCSLGKGARTPFSPLGWVSGGPNVPTRP